MDKTASLHSNPGVPITSVNLSLGQTITIQYKIVITRDCEEGFDPNAMGSSAQVIDPNAPAGTFPNHLRQQHQPARVGDVHVYRDITAHSCDDFDVTNKVDVIDSDPLNPFATDTNTLHVDVHCENGCTLTQGYWKTHSTYGPASKPDATWNLLPGGLGPTRCSS